MIPGPIVAQSWKTVGSKADIFIVVLKLKWREKEYERKEERR
jgi:hypothetical protein